MVIFGTEVSRYVTNCARYHSAADLAGKTAAEQDQIILNYMGDHAGDASLKRLIEMSATITHELGHGTGVIHHTPETDSPTQPDHVNCTIRYYSPNEYPVDPGDRFELRARGNQPSEFCRVKHNCWGQLAINDDPAAPPSTGAALAAALRTEPVVLHQSLTPQAQPEAPALSISADLPGRS